MTDFKPTDAEASIVPAHDRVGIRPEKAGEVSKGGIIMPSIFEQPQETGHIVSLGAHVTLYRIGDLVYFGKYAGTRVQIGENEEIVLLRVDDVLCKRKTTPAPLTPESHLH